MVDPGPAHVTSGNATPRERERERERESICNNDPDTSSDMVYEREAPCSIQDQIGLKIRTPHWKDSSMIETVKTATNLKQTDFLLLHLGIHLVLTTLVKTGQVMVYKTPAGDAASGLRESEGYILRSIAK